MATQNGANQTQNQTKPNETKQVKIGIDYNEGISSKIIDIGGNHPMGKIV